MPFVAAPAFLSAAAIATTAIGVVMQRRGARQAAKSEAALYKYNAKVAEQEAQQRRYSSMEEQHVRRDRMRRVLKSQRALYAKSRVQMAGSPMEIQLYTAETMASDIALLAYGREIGVTRIESRAGIERFRARETERAGRLSVGTTLFGGISSMAQMGIEYQLNR